MEEVNPIVVKVFLLDSNVTQEVRRFYLCPEGRPCFSVIKHHVIRAFPHLEKEEFVISWRDREGDDVRINSDEELTDAMFETRQVMKTDIFKIYVRTVSTKSSTIKTDGDYHQHVVCDGCQGPVKGFRYKCLQCTDFDLCSKCEGNGVHANHNMMRLVQPVFFGPWRQFMRRCHRFFPVYENGTWNTPDVKKERRREKQKRRCEEEEKKEAQGSSHTDESSSSERERSSHCGKKPKQQQFYRGCPYQRDGEKKSKEETSNRSSGPPPSPFAPFPPFSEIMNGFWTGLSGGCPATPAPPPPRMGFPPPPPMGFPPSPPMGFPPSGIPQPSVEMLHNIGQHVRNILDPFGVDVHVDVEHNGKRTCSKNKKGTDGKSKKKDDTEMETTEKPAEKEKEKPAQEGKAEAENAPDSCETVAEGVAAMHLDDKDDSSEDVMKDYVVLNPMTSSKPNEKGDWQMYPQLGEEFKELASAPSTENVQSKEASPDNVQAQEPAAEKVQTQKPAAENVQTQEPAAENVQTQEPAAEKVQTHEAAAEKVQTQETSPEKAVEATEEVAEAAAKTPPQPKVSHPDPKVAKALGQMLSMGFTNEGGWLAQLLEIKGGDIGQALDVLVPAFSKNSQ